MKEPYPQIARAQDIYFLKEIEGNGAKEDPYAKPKETHKGVINTAIKALFVKRLAFLLGKPTDLVDGEFVSDEIGLYKFNRLTGTFGITPVCLKSLTRIAKKLDCTVLDFRVCDMIEALCLSQFFSVEMPHIKNLKRIILSERICDKQALVCFELAKQSMTLKGKMVTLEVQPPLAAPIQDKPDRERLRTLLQERRLKIIQCLSLMLHQPKEKVADSLAGYTEFFFDPLHQILDGKCVLTRLSLNAACGLGQTLRASVLDLSFYELESSFFGVCEIWERFCTTELPSFKSLERLILGRKLTKKELATFLNESLGRKIEIQVGVQRDFFKLKQAETIAQDSSKACSGTT